MTKLIFMLFALALSFGARAWGEDSAYKYFAYRSFNPEFEAMKDFAGMDVNTVAIFPAHSWNSLGEPYSKYPPIWTGFKQYDFRSFDRQLDDVLKINPAAEFVIIVDLNSPMFLMHRLCVRGDSAEADSYMMLSCALSNPEWRKHTADYLKALLEYAESKYGNKIKAYLLACGMTDEWMDYSLGTAGRFKTQKWDEWRKARGLDKAPVPSYSDMDSASFENLLRDPSKEKSVVEYFEFTSDIVADGIDFFSKTARETVGKDKKIGVFFGYIVQLTNNRMVNSGHLAYERVFALPQIDFFISPGSYCDRNIGDGSGFMCADGTRRRFNKGWLHEIDHFTLDTMLNYEDSRIPGQKNAWSTRAENDAGLKREFALASVNGASLWCFDMWGGFYKTKETLALIEKSHEIWKKFAACKSEPVAEVAMIVDPQSALYVNDSIKNSVISDINVGTRSKLNKLGAPFQIFSFNDIGHVDLSRYKLLIFPGMFKLTKERQEILDKYVFKEGKTAAFVYAPAIIDEEKLDKKLTENFTGFPFGGDTVRERVEGRGKLVYIPGYAALTPTLLKKLASESGVKIYVKDEIPIFASEKLLAIHTANGGEKTITLPRKCARITELYTGKVIAENTDTFSYIFNTPDTALFELEY